MGSADINAIQVWNKCEFLAGELGLKIEISRFNERMVLLSIEGARELGTFVNLTDLCKYLEGYRAGFNSGYHVGRYFPHRLPPAPTLPIDPTSVGAGGEALASEGLPTTTREMLKNWDSDKLAQEHAAHIAKHQAIVTAVGSFEEAHVGEVKPR